MMLYEYAEDIDKYVKIIKGAKDTIKNAILNVSSNSNGLSNNINGVTNPDVDNSDINAAIEYLIANTNFTSIWNKFRKYKNQSFQNWKDKKRIFQSDFEFYLITLLQILTRKVSLDLSIQ